MAAPLGQPFLCALTIAFSKFCSGYVFSLSREIHKLETGGAVNRTYKWVRRSLVIGFTLGMISNGVADDRPNKVGQQQFSAQLTMYTPSVPIDCETSNPWKAGRWELAGGAHVPSGGCIGLQITISHEAIVFLLHEGGSGKLTRFLPSTCLLTERTSMDSGEHWFPQPRDGREQIIFLDHDAGVETFHLVALPENASAESLLKLLADVPASDPSCEKIKPATGNAPQFGDLIQLMDSANAVSQPSVQLLSESLIHY